MGRRVTLPLTGEHAALLSAGDSVLLTGTLYTARDAAHRRIADALAQGKEPPFPLENAIIYYTGPTPAGPHQIIGSAGPTTSSRMDPYTPALLDRGLRGMIGKGERSPEVAAAMLLKGALYFAAIGGAGALLSDRIKSSEIIAYEDLGTEAVRRLWVEDFPVTVIIDCWGNNWYTQGVEQFRHWRAGE